MDLVISDQRGAAGYEMCSGREPRPSLRLLQIEGLNRVLFEARDHIDANEETRLRALIQEATSLPQLPEVSEPDPSGRQQVAKQLDAWLRDWRESARVLISRRDYQIRLGLAERRAAKGDEAEAQG